MKARVSVDVSNVPHDARRVGQLSATGFIRQAELIPAIVPVSSATLWRMVGRGDFPRPVKLSARVTAWRCESVREWLDSAGGAEP